MPTKRNSLQRDLFFGVLVTLIVFAGAFLFGGPFLTASPSAAAASAVSSVQTPLRSTTVNGTVKRNGNQIYFSDDAGVTFQLNHPDQLAAYEGRYVTVTGTINPQTGFIYVEKIHTIDA